MTDHPMEMIRWKDTHSQTGGWMEIASVIQQMTDPPIVLTIGWVIHEDSDVVILAGSHFTDWSQVGDTIAILKVQIVNRYPTIEPVDMVEAAA